jgi:hypothetical protein
MAFPQAFKILIGYLCTRLSAGRETLPKGVVKRELLRRITGNRFQLGSKQSRLFPHLGAHAELFVG